MNFGRWSCACQDADGVLFPLLHSGSSWSNWESPETDAALDVWDRLTDLERECDGVAADRQRSLDDPPLTPDLDDDGGRPFHEYLYGPTDGPRHPVLAQVAELADRIRADRDGVATRIAADR